MKAVRDLGSKISSKLKRPKKRKKPATPKSATPHSATPKSAPPPEDKTPAVQPPSAGTEPQEAPSAAVPPLGTGLPAGVSAEEKNEVDELRRMINSGSGPKSNRPSNQSTPAAAPAKDGVKVEEVTGDLKKQAIDTAMGMGVMIDDSLGLAMEVAAKAIAQGAIQGVIASGLVERVEAFALHQKGSRMVFNFDAQGDVRAKFVFVDEAAVAVSAAVAFTALVVDAAFSVKSEFAPVIGKTALKVESAAFTPASFVRGMTEAAIQGADVR